MKAQKHRILILFVRLIKLFLLFDKPQSFWKNSNTHTFYFHSNKNPWTDTKPPVCILTPAASTTKSKGTDGHIDSQTDVCSHGCGSTGWTDRRTFFILVQKKKKNRKMVLTLKAAKHQLLEPSKSLSALAWNQNWSELIRYRTVFFTIIHQ